jgi:hypothetical protein
MREIPRIRQHDGEPLRRWFTDEYWDLFVWEADGDVVAFQLSYGKPDSERTVSWRRGGDATHFAVDDGESHPGSHRSPILVPDGDLNVRAVLSRFKRDSSAVDSHIRKRVVIELVRYERAVG